MQGSSNETQLPNKKDHELFVGTANLRCQFVNSVNAIQWNRNRGTGVMKLLLNIKSGKLRLSLTDDNTSKVYCNIVSLGMASIYKSGTTVVNWAVNAKKSGKTRLLHIATFSTPELASQFYNVMSSCQQKLKVKGSYSSDIAKKVKKKKKKKKSNITLSTNDSPFTFGSPKSFDFNFTIKSSGGGETSENEVVEIKDVHLSPAEIAADFKRAIDDTRKNVKLLDKPIMKTPMKTAGSPVKELEIVYEVKVSPEEKAAALKLQLPENFYAYKQKEGRRGCKKPIILTEYRNQLYPKTTTFSFDMNPQFGTNETPVTTNALLDNVKICSPSNIQTTPTTATSVTGQSMFGQTSSFKTFNFSFDSDKSIFDGASKTSISGESSGDNIVSFSTAVKTITTAVTAANSVSKTSIVVTTTTTNQSSNSVFGANSTPFFKMTFGNNSALPFGSLTGFGITSLTNIFSGTTTTTTTTTTATTAANVFSGTTTMTTTANFFGSTSMANIFGGSMAPTTTNVFGSRMTKPTTTNIFGAIATPTIFGMKPSDNGQKIEDGMDAEYTICVNNLPLELNKNVIRYIFSQYGTIVGMFHLRNATWMYITYGMFQEAQLAIRELDNKKPLYLKVAFAKRRSMKEEQKPNVLKTFESSKLGGNIADSLPVYNDIKHPSIDHSQSNTSSEYAMPQITTHGNANYGLPVACQSPYEIYNHYASTNHLLTRGVTTRGVTPDRKRRVSLGPGYILHSYPEPDANIEQYILKICEQRSDELYECPQKKSKITVQDCAVCSTRTTKHCAECTTYYCSKPCQMKDWSQHQILCERIPKLMDETINDCKSSLQINQEVDQQRHQCRM